MRRLTNYLYLVLFSTLLLFASCSTDSDDKVNDTANAQLSSTLKSILQDIKAANSSTSGNDNNGNDNDYGDDYLEEFECFEFQYPITAIQTDGTEVVITDDEALFDFLDAQEEGYEPNFVFPMTILFEEGFSAQVNSLEELEDAFDYCEYEFECFELIFPVQLIDENGITFTINNEEELFAFIDAQSEDYEIEVVYPIEILIDEEIVVVEDDDELDDIYEECDDDWDDVMCFEFVYPIQMTYNGETVTINDEDTLFDFIEGIQEGEDVDFVYPFDVILEDDTTQTISNVTELFTLFDSCI